MTNEQSTPKRMTLIEFLNQPTSSERLAARLAASGVNDEREAIEEARSVLRGTSGLNGEQALGVLEDLRQILGVTV